jgi:hypothetical protein
VKVTPDGVRYLAMAGGMAQPMPFHLRWLASFALRQRLGLWIASAWLHAVTAAALTALLALQHGATETQAAVAALLWLGLPSTAFALRCPVLVDMPQAAYALGSAVLWPWLPEAAVGVVLLGACISERVPVFAALFAWEPILLVGLVAPLLRRLLWKPGDLHERDPLSHTMTDPLGTGLASHAGRWRDPLLLLAPWGACLAALAAPVPDRWWLAAVAVAYAQLLLATDSVRLYQMAAPAVCVAAALVIPADWALPVLVAHWLNPLRGDGV